MTGGCLALSLAIAPGCGDGSDEQVDGPRRAVLQSLADVVIIPTYREVAVRLDAFAAIAVALRQEPTAERLAAAKESWRSARHTWKQSEAFRFGPTEDLHLRIRSKVDWSPISPARIEEQIAGTAEMTAEYIDTLGTNRRGFLTIEYLLFDGGNGSVLAQDTGGDRRRAYIAAIAADIALQAHKLVEAWVTEGGNYRFELIAAGQQSVEFESLKDAVDTVVNTAVQLSATIEENKIGRPYGIKNNGVPQPDSVETAYSDNSLADILDNVESIENIYRGRRENHAGQGLQMLVAEVSPEIDAEILGAVALVKQRIRAVPPPLEGAVLNARPAVQAALDAAIGLRLALAVDLVSALGTTPVFVGDGD
jgi:predicted lipoprotein